jgi:hypothetical protein
MPTTAAAPTTQDSRAVTAEPAQPTETVAKNTVPGPEIQAVDPDAFRPGGYQGDVVFTSPTGNIWCRLGKGDYNAGCQARHAPVPPGADCDGNEYYPADMLSRGFYLFPNSVLPTCFNQGVFTAEHAKALPYGKSISANGYTCVSRVTEMTCLNPAEHGFQLSMQFAGIF